MALALVKAPKADPYNLDPKFEREAVGLACSDAGFYRRVGHAIDPACLGSADAKTVAQAAHEVAAERGVPGSPTYVLQHLRRRMNEGKATHEQLAAAGAYFDAFDEMFPPPDVESVVAQLAKELRRRQESAALKAGMDAYANRKPLAVVAELLEKAERLGSAEESSGVLLGDAAAWAEADEEAHQALLFTGVMELDDLLGGGLPKRELGLVSLATGRGKSMTLAHFAGQAAYDGRFVAVATTEVSVAIWHARVVANMTGIPIDALLKPGDGRDRAAKLLKARQAATGGGVAVRYFTPGATTVGEIGRWCRDLSRDQGRDVDLLVVDSADDLTIPQTRQEVPGHERVKRVFTELRRLVHDELQCWGWTVSQPKGVSSTGAKRKRIGTDDLADGMGKARVCDKLLVAEIAEDQMSIEFFLPKNRTGKACGSSGPIPLDLACAAIGPIVRFGPAAPAASGGTT
jgi:RecA/RadA recombinase